MSEEHEDHSNDWVESDAETFERFGEELDQLVTRLMEDVSDLSVVSELEINMTDPSMTCQRQVRAIIHAVLATMDLSEIHVPQIMKGVEL
jgi:hypothetical protein